jgi:hypothetical protein
MKNRLMHTMELSGFLLLLCCVTSPPALAQNAKLQINNLEKLSSKAAEVVDVTLDGSLLKLASKFLTDEGDADEAAAREMIRNLKGVYVKSFEFDKEGEYTEADLDSIRAQLKAPAWSRIVGVRSKREKENAEVYLMTNGSEKNVLGLAIISAEPKQLTVVNIVGPIDLEKLSSLEGHLGVPQMDLEKAKKSEGQAGGHEKQK